MTDLLFDTPGNPRPHGGRSGYLSTTDGRRLRTAVFPARAHGPRQGTVLVLSGRNEAIERYFETIGDLCTRGFDCVTFDWRGQGGSDRLIRDGGRGYVRSFRHYMHDVKQVVTEIMIPDCPGPFTVLAHSAGALVALLTSSFLAEHVERMVLLAPFLETTGMPLGVAGIRRLITPLTYLGLGSVYAYGGPRPLDPPPFVTNRLTTDQRRFERNQAIYVAHPELALGGPTLGWISAAAWASKAVQDHAFVERFNIPTLVIAAGGDQVVSTPAIERYVRRLKTASLITIDGARHEILQEADIYREQFFAAFDSFVPGTRQAAVSPARQALGAR